MAKLETSVSLYGDKLELKVYGFNDKLPVLLSKVLAKTKSFSPRDDRFMVYANSLNILPLICSPRYCLFSCLNLIQQHTQCNSTSRVWGGWCVCRPSLSLGR